DKAETEAEAGGAKTVATETTATAGRAATPQGGEDPARRVQRLGLPLSRHRSRQQEAVPRCPGRQAARSHDAQGRCLLGGHDLQRPPLAAVPAARLQSATARPDRALPARPGC